MPHGRGCIHALTGSALLALLCVGAAYYDGEPSKGAPARAPGK